MSKSVFSFGTTSSDGSSTAFVQSPISNQTGSPTTNPASNPFGGGTNAANSFGGNTQLSSSASPFATAGGQNPPNFGLNASSTPASGTTTPSLFGASTGNLGSSQSGGLFGGAGNSTGTSNTFSGSIGLSFAKKGEEQKDKSNPTASGAETPSQAPSIGLFGGPSTTSAPSSFGTGTFPSSAPTGSTTPAPSKTGALFNFTNSTTPAGLPPADNNVGNKSSSIGLFGSTQPSSGGLFGSQKPPDSTSKPANTQSSNIFGGTPTSSAPSSNPFTSNTTTATGAGLFSGLNTAKSTTTESSGTAASGALFATPKPSFSFKSTPTTSSPLAKTQAANPFSAPTSSPSSTATTLSAQTTSAFGSTTSTTSLSSGTSQAPSMFAGLGKPSSMATSASTSAPGTSSSAPTSNMLAPKSTQTDSGTTPASSAAEKESTTTTAPAAASGLAASVASPLAASNVGPAPQLSRLKNKTMDEIITRWATDLSTYQKEFQNQAAKVASWDRLLVENGDKIQKLYTSTFEAERASVEVERQLASVESQQDELTAWLDYYEGEVDDMFSKQVGHGESLQGPDQERERTYKLAEKLTDRLDEMGKDLSSMIQEINAASATLTKSSKPDDPLSQIVRVLNGHLSQLQWIDQNSAALQAKIVAAQKAGQSIGANGYAGREDDPADDFYRSYMGRR